jgi:hypothetical protein
MGQSQPQLEQLWELERKLKEEQQRWRNYVRRSSRSSGVTTMAVWLDIELATSTIASAMTTGVIIHLSSPG